MRVGELTFQNADSESFILSETSVSKLRFFRSGCGAERVRIVGFANGCVQTSFFSCASGNKQIPCKFRFVPLLRLLNPFRLGLLRCLPTCDCIWSRVFKNENDCSTDEPNPLDRVRGLWAAPASCENFPLPENKRLHITMC